MAFDLFPDRDACPICGRPGYQRSNDAGTHWFEGVDDDEIGTLNSEIDRLMIANGRLVTERDEARAALKALVASVKLHPSHNSRLPIYESYTEAVETARALAEGWSDEKA